MTMQNTTKNATVALAALIGLTAVGRPAAAADSPAAAARADIQRTLGFVPQFISKFPDVALPGVWEEMKSLQMNPHTALPPKIKELVGLAVAAQIPCHYCVVGHTEFAKLSGASDAEVGEAVSMAALTRHWSTFLQGIQTDETKFRADIQTLVDNAKRGMSAAPTSPPKPIAVVDGESALRDVQQSFGVTPEFLKRFPESARAGAWREMKDVQMNPKTALAPKYKELIGLAVASQIPCRYCVVGHTEFAKLSGATDAEITEAIAMAALTRNMSTMLNGLQVDEAGFRRDVDRLVKGAKAAAKHASTTASAR
jgi:AhpD family alkylhydroperoxidase